MKMIGVKMVPFSYADAGTWVADVIYDHEYRKNNVDMTGIAWGYEAYDPGLGLIETYYGGDGDTVFNFAFISNETLDALLWEAYLELDQTKRQDLYDIMANMVQNEIYGYMYLGQLKTQNIFSASYAGFSTRMMYWYHIVPAETPTESDTTTSDRRDIPGYSLPIMLVTIISSMLIVSKMLKSKKRKK
jgi:ABC-type transport system substrate-binding protein